MSFFGLQGRVALTDRWSLVVNKFGGITLNSKSPSPYRDSTGFAELWLGPKYTFYRDGETGTLGAAGLQFQIPTGSGGTFQNTGSLSLVPYASFGQNFLRDFQFGSFNFLANTGYSFSTNRARSDYYWLSAHLDFDVGNLHRFYPLMELNWFLYTANGQSTPIGAEGRDLINFGGHASGTGLLTGAFGGRVKITESAQLGRLSSSPSRGGRICSAIASRSISSCAIDRRCKSDRESFVEFGEGFVLDLADAFAGEAEALADFLERLRVLVVEAEAHPQDSGFARVHALQEVQDLLQVVGFAHDLVGGLGSRVHQHFLDRPPLFALIRL